MRTSHRRPLALVALALPLALAACGGSDGGTSASTTTTRSASSGITGATQPPPALPYALGTRAALGDWELAVDSATPGTTTTVSARLRNVRGRPVAAPASAVLTLQDGSATSPIAATVTGLPATMAPNVDVPISITFVATNAPTDPYLHWSGTSKGAIEGTFKLTPGEPTVPVG